MRLDDLEPHEQRALAALVRLLTRMDDKLSDEETAALAGLAQEMGSLDFWGRMREAQEELTTPDAVMAAASGSRAPRCASGCTGRWSASLPPTGSTWPRTPFSTG